MFYTYHENFIYLLILINACLKCIFSEFLFFYYSQELFKLAYFMLAYGYTNFIRHYMDDLTCYKYFTFNNFNFIHVHVYSTVTFQPIPATLQQLIRLPGNRSPFKTHLCSKNYMLLYWSTVILMLQLPRFILNIFMLTIHETINVL